MPMYSFVPADEEARKAKPRDPVFLPNEMVNNRSKTSLLDSDENKENAGSNIECTMCDKVYKNKKSLADHKRSYHSKLPLRLFPNRNDKDSNESDSDSTMVRHSRKCKILIDEDDKKVYLLILKIVQIVTMLIAVNDRR